jgi:hypothetical protein
VLLAEHSQRRWGYAFLGALQREHSAPKHWVKLPQVSDDTRYGGRYLTIANTEKSIEFCALSSVADTLVRFARSKARWQGERTDAAAVNYYRGILRAACLPTKSVPAPRCSTADTARASGDWKTVERR